MLQNSKTNIVKFTISGNPKGQKNMTHKKYNCKKNHSVETDPEIKDDVTNKDIKIGNINMLCMFKKT